MKKLVSIFCICLLLLSVLMQIFSSVVATRSLDASSTPNSYFMNLKSTETFGNNENGATYVGIAKYYDNRKSVVTSSHDDLKTNSSAWEGCLSMLTRKKIYQTVGIITDSANWTYVQYWVNQGYTEAASHSRNHVSVPYTGSRVSYEGQINGSKKDIIGNLTLPTLWRYGEKEYVYAWIEPFGQSDATVRHWLGISGYLLDRGISLSSQVYGLASWDSNEGLFNRVGYTVEVGKPPWGGDTSVSSLNSKFDKAYRDGTVYHLMTHPSYVNWSKGSYADQHTDYISNRTDVWYVPLYLYHWADVKNITRVTFLQDGTYGTFKISINHNDHETYGVSYPITYVFNIPQNWTSGHVYCRFKDGGSWALMENKNSGDFFNGINASRFDFSGHKIYISIAFNHMSDYFYLQIRPSPVYDKVLIAGAGRNAEVAVSATNLKDHHAQIVGALHEKVLPIVLFGGIITITTINLFKKIKKLRWLSNKNKFLQIKMETQVSRVCQRPYPNYSAGAANKKTNAVAVCGTHINSCRVA
jgi:hypothetical protein